MRLGEVGLTLWKDVLGQPGGGNGDDCVGMYVVLGSFDGKGIAESDEANFS